MKDLSRAIAIAPFPGARLVLAQRRTLGAARPARPLGWPPAIPPRDLAVLAEVSRAVAVALLVMLIALAMVLFLVHTLIRGVPAAMNDMRTYDGAPGGCGGGDPGAPTRSELDGAPAPLAPAFAC